VTTDKTRCTIYLRETRPLDDLVELARRSVPIEARGRITRSTAIEAAVLAALAELRTNGKESAWLAALVALPRATDGNGQDEKTLSSDGQGFAGGDV
jgi:hypothetical protein